MATYEPSTTEKACPFCEIVSGKLSTPGIFWEDARFMAFLAIDPNTTGFTCVISKQHHGSDVLALDAEVLQSFVLAAQKVAEKLKSHFQDVGRVGLIMEGTGIDHAHIKRVPMHGTQDLKLGWRQYRSGQEFWFDHYAGWLSSGGGPMASPDDLRRLAEQLKAVV